MTMVCGFIGWIVGIFLGFMVRSFVPFLGVLLFSVVFGGLYIYIERCIEKDKENKRRTREEDNRRRKQEEYNRQQKLQKRFEVQSLAKKYPEATKHYFKMHWGITKVIITDYDITDDKVEILLGHRYSYERDEQICNAAYKAKLEAERVAKIRRDSAIRESERRIKIARAQAEEQAKKSLSTKVSHWDALNGNFRYNYLLNYYPTTCEFEASEGEWLDRWTVWNFKNTPGKTSSFDHKRTLDIVIPKIKSKLVATFGMDSLKYLTFVCIPASSAIKTQARYEEFSQRLCSETGMINAYVHMQVITSSQEKKFGGSGISANNVSFDNSFFKGKYVLLFDDVITKGDSMLRFKHKMEELGAIVVGGFSIGKTTHMR